MSRFQFSGEFLVLAYLVASYSQLASGNVSWRPCWKNVTLTELDPPSCASCRSRCGRIVDLHHQPSCSCDPKCFHYEDCCQDLVSECPQIYQQSMKMVKSYPTECRPVSLNPEEDWQSNYHLVSTCKEQSCGWSKESPYDFLPVADRETGYHFVNVRCALCNGVDSLIPWHINVTCKNNMLKTGQNETNLTTITSQGNLLKLIQQYLRSPAGWSACHIDIRPPEGNVAEPRLCVSESKLKMECNESCLNADLIHACAHLPVNYFHQGGQLFRNHYCALCTGNWPPRITCGVGKGAREAATFWAFRYQMSLVFDFSPHDGLRVGGEETNPPPCPPGHTWLDLKCRRISRTLEVPHSKDSQFCNPNVDTSIRSFVKELIMTEVHVEIKPYFILKQNKSVLELVIIGKVNVSTETKAKWRVLVKQYVARQVNQFCSDDKVNSISINAVTLLFVNAPNKCSYFPYSPQEYTLYSNMTIAVESTGRTYRSGDYYIGVNGTAFICVEEEKIGKRSIALAVTTIVLLAMSAVSLSFRVGIHFCLPELQNSAGRTQTSLAAAMLLATVSLLVGPALPRATWSCHVFGVFLHWALLAMFTWMSIVSVDIWRMVWKSSRLYKMKKERRSFIFFSIIAWGVPTLLVTAGEILNYRAADPRFKPEYGSYHCWFNQRYALIVFFIVPVTLCLLINIVSFALCITMLLRNRCSNISSNTVRSDYSISLYFKLFILMGISWIMGLVAEVSDHEVVDYIYTVLNASQGVLLTIGTACMGQVGRSFRLKVRKGRYIRAPSVDSSSRSEMATKESTADL